MEKCASKVVLQLYKGLWVASPPFHIKCFALTSRSVHFGFTGKKNWTKFWGWLLYLWGEKEVLRSYFIKKTVSLIWRCRIRRISVKISKGKSIHWKSRKIYEERSQLVKSYRKRRSSFEEGIESSRNYYNEIRVAPFELWATITIPTESKRDLRTQNNNIGGSDSFMNQ